MSKSDIHSVMVITVMGRNKQGSGGEHGVGGIGVCHFKRAIKEGFTERAAFEKRP